MRKVKTIKIDEKEITVKELRVKDIKKIIDEFALGDIKGIGDFYSFIIKYIPDVIGLAANDFEELAPSELTLIFDAFCEVNADFLLRMEKVGALSVLRMIPENIRKSLTALQAV